MSLMLEAAKVQFRDRMSGKLQSSEIPEWVVDGKPSIIYYKPAMNFKDQGEVLKLHAENKQAEAVAITFILPFLGETPRNSIREEAAMTARIFHRL